MRMKCMSVILLKVLTVPEGFQRNYFHIPMTYWRPSATNFPIYPYYYLPATVFDITSISSCIKRDSRSLFFINNFICKLLLQCLPTVDGPLKYVTSNMIHITFLDDTVCYVDPTPHCLNSLCSYPN
jgi:hypothetical protein